MIQIIPAVLATTEEQFEKDITKLSSSESLQEGWVHIDFADNIFVQNQTISPEVVAKFPFSFHKEAHLMVSYPKEWIDSLKDTGFERVIFHLESEGNIEKLIEYIKNKGLEVGIAIKNGSDIEKLAPFVEKIDVLLLMSVVPGFQGQVFIPEALEKIRGLKSKGWQVKIGVDGAVKDTNIKEVMEAGADFVIMGSYLLKGNIAENLEKVWEQIYG